MKDQENLSPELDYLNSIYKSIIGGGRVVTFMAHDIELLREILTANGIDTEECD